MVPPTNSQRAHAAMITLATGRERPTLRVEFCDAMDAWIADVNAGKYGFADNDTLTYSNAVRLLDDVNAVLKLDARATPACVS